MPARIILLTGFAPFGAERINPSWEVARRMDGDLIGGLQVKSVRLPVNCAAAARRVNAAIVRYRPRAILGLACAFLFSSLMAVAHALTFPGLFTPAGLFAGQQTTAWLYFLWHGGVSLLVMSYALLAGREGDAGTPRGSARRGILTGAGATLAAVCALMLLTTAGHDLLPVIMKGNSDASAKVVVASLTWLLSVAALPIL